MSIEPPSDSRRGWWILPFAVAGAVVWVMVVVAVWRWLT